MEKDIDRLVIGGTEYSTEVPESSMKPFEGFPDRNMITAFIPGVVVEVRVQVGDAVEPGTVLLLLDAMKIHNELCSESSGRVAAIRVSNGDAVQKGQLLVEIAV